jgi:hypothetical protein
MKTTGLILATLAFVLLSPERGCSASDDDSTDLFLSQHQAGLRLGVWSNQGELPPAEGRVNETGSFETNIGSSSAYVEGFFGYRLLPWLTGELSLGTVNRGSISIEDQGAQDIGHLMIYPILLQFRLNSPPLPGTDLYPFAVIGGGLLYGRRTVQFTNAVNYYSNWQEESATDFNYVIGGGVDWPVARQIGLEFSVKYIPMNLSLVTIEKQDALAFGVGVKYLYLSK